MREASGTSTIANPVARLTETDQVHHRLQAAGVQPLDPLCDGAQALGRLDRHLGQTRLGTRGGNQHEREVADQWGCCSHADVRP